MKMVVAYYFFFFFFFFNSYSIYHPSGPMRDLYYLRSKKKSKIRIRPFFHSFVVMTVILRKSTINNVKPVYFSQFMRPLVDIVLDI